MTDSFAPAEQGGSASDGAIVAGPTNVWRTGAVWDRLAAWGAALVLVIGSLLFLAGGRAHPAIAAAPGSAPDAFFHGFAATVRQASGWHAMHLLILVGPLCWAVGAPALIDAIRPDARALGAAARSALGLAGALWAVAFVLDGFGAPVYAAALAGQRPPDSAAPADAALTAFRANAVVMSRLGLVSWVAGGLGMVALGAALLVPGARTRWRTSVGVSGLLLGAWPLLAALEGEYATGPFTSRFWMVNALAAALWYVALAGCAGRKAGR